MRNKITQSLIGMACSVVLFISVVPCVAAAAPEQGKMKFYYSQPDGQPDGQPAVFQPEGKVICTEPADDPASPGEPAAKLFTKLSCKRGSAAPAPFLQSPLLEPDAATKPYAKKVIPGVKAPKGGDCPA